jgi:intracellular sulfur oxidation DsrE/DsrF family protein
MPTVFARNIRQESEEHMSERVFVSAPERRSFLTRLSAGVAAFAGIMSASAAVAQCQSPTVARWQPERHEKDDWLDKLPGKHRFVFDTTTPEGIGQAIVFASNFIRVNQSDYGVANNELAVIIVARSRSTPFAYTDAMWAKYGAPMSSRAEFTDPKTKQPPRANLYRSGDYGAQLANRGTTLDSLLKQGVQLAVCSVATRGFATAIAQATGGNTDSINNELVANLVDNSRMVPAGIVAVNRAQERGYSFVSA